VWRLAAGSAAEITSGGAPVMLEWDNGQGLLYTREITLDENFLFSVTDRVLNRSGSEVRLNPYQLVARNSLPADFSGFFVLHEGPIGALNGKEEKLDYADMRDGEILERKNATGWLGMTDKYWMVSMLPSPDDKNNARIVAAEENGTYLYQTDLVGSQQVVAAGGTAEHATHVYAGVKRTEVMHAYEEKLGVRQLDLSLDFGMWYFITKPFYYLLHLLFSTTGSIALGILLMTVVVRAGVFPLANKSFRSMARMKVISPQLQALQEKHKGDKAGLQMAIFELYKRENVNPFSGCWPILIQIPIFFALYKVILLSVELRHAPFWGWISDLSAPDPTSMFNLFGLIDWTPPQMLMIGGWPLLFCLSMIVQKRLSPPMPDPVQERIQTMFPYIITVMMAHFASGLVIYWTWSNVLSCIQQYYILKKVGGEDTSLLRGHAARRKKKE
jgi:YidC/Oxa1 family membrane protein insertase